MRGATSTKQALLDAAVTLFAARGVADVGIREIASAAACSNPALFRHFKTKDALSLAVFEEAYRRFAHALGSAGAGSGVEAWLQGALEAIRDTPSGAHYVLSNMDAFWPRMPGDLRTASIPRLARGVLERGRAAGALRADLDLEMAGLLLTSLLAEAARAARLRGAPLDPRTTAQRVTALLMDGMEGRRPRRDGRAGAPSAIDGPEEAEDEGA